MLQVVSAPLLTPGLALLDAPDIDSVVAANRALAQELLAAADLWLFVTTAARYADAVPWGVLRGARDRGTAVAIVLDRVPAEAGDDIAADFARHAAPAQELDNTPLFVVAESTLDGTGCCRSWRWRRSRRGSTPWPRAARRSAAGRPGEPCSAR